MIVARRSSARTSVRQVVVALYKPVSAFAALSRPLALDVVAALGAVNGFTVALVCTDAAAAREIGEELPAGVDLRLHPSGNDESAALFFARDYVRNGFERVIFVAADTLGITARLLSTTSSLLDVESPVIGKTRGGTPYLVGVNDTAMTANQPETLAALTAISAGPAPVSLRGRPLDRLTRLGELTDWAEVREAVDERRDLLPRTVGQLAQCGP